MAKGTGETPLMKQHQAIKARYPDAILLFRVGDFYETFGQDAVNAAGVLGITLTRRNNGSASSLELAGFPHHALDTYLHKLVKAGYRVAICDQLEDPKTAKGVVKRGVTELVTPGVAVNDKLLEQGHNNFLAAIYPDDTGYGLAFVDVSTGEFLVAEGDRDYADKLLQGLRPSELLFPRSRGRVLRESLGEKTFLYGLDDWIFSEPYATEQLLRHFGTHSLKGFGVEEMASARLAAGAILHYLRDTEHPHLQHITGLQCLRREDHLWMDRFTVRNLELLSPIDTDYTLFRTINQTRSPMGARLLRRWMLMPLIEAGGIRERLDATEYLIRETERRETLVSALSRTGDLERLCAKIPLRKIQPRDVLQIARSLKETEEIRNACAHAIPLAIWSNRLDPLPALEQLIRQTVDEQAPALAAKGGVIAEGVDAELDRLRAISRGGKNYLVELQKKEAQLTGIPSLKIGYNNVFGYYLEVTHTHRSKVPENWIRKQTLTQAERYITPELKEYEEQITGAEEKILEIEQRLFLGLLEELQPHIAAMQTNAQALAALDCLCCFAQNALKYQYRRPDIHDGDELELTESRHPVIEQHLPPGERYITNDIRLDKNAQQLIILTGPNMSGKSALLRQTALITLMAHMGSFVPATKARIPLTDKIFTRVGASDNLSGGESTFMVEMNETASIINNLSDRSLVILDEIGRGTSTYDGISIAWSIAEHLHQASGRPLTLFATHYHELNELESRWERIRNYHITYREVDNRVIFLRTLAAGGSMHSFGIHVARMAGMPKELIARAEAILRRLEEQRDTTDPSQRAIPPAPASGVQLSIFDAHTLTFESIRQALDSVDIDRLTPVEALIKLKEIKDKLH